MQATYSVLLATVVVGSGVPTDLNDLLVPVVHVKALAVPSSVKRKTVFWPFDGVPASALMVSAFANAVICCWSYRVLSHAQGDAIVVWELTRVTTPPEIAAVPVTSRPVLFSSIFLVKVIALPAVPEGAVNHWC